MDFGKVPSPELMAQTLKNEGLYQRQEGNRIYFGQNEWIDIKTGKAQFSQQRDMAQLKQAHTRTIIQTQAKRFGWGLKQVAENKYEMVKARQL